MYDAESDLDYYGDDSNDYDAEDDFDDPRNDDRSVECDDCGETFILSEGWHECAKEVA